MSSILGYLKKPVILGIVIGILGFSLGLLWGWVIQPVEWKDASPTLLHELYQEDYLRMTIDSYGLNGNKELAIKRWEALGEAGKKNLEYILQNPGTQDPTLIMQYSTLVNSGVTLPTATPAAVPTVKGKSPIAQIGLIAVAVLAVLVVLYAVVKFLKPKIKSSGSPTQRAGDLNRQVEMTDYAAIGEETPISQYVTTYVIGDDLFDDSFSVDSASGEFLGECGVGISETIGVGEPKKVSAFEVWLFDKNDIQTVTKVLLSSHAHNDLAIFQRLKAKGEPMLIERGQKITLETATLQMIATVAEVEYGEGALPQESYFNRVTLELAIWQKNSPNG